VTMTAMASMTTTATTTANVMTMAMAMVWAMLTVMAMATASSMVMGIVTAMVIVVMTMMAMAMVMAMVTALGMAMAMAMAMAVMSGKHGTQDVCTVNKVRKSHRRWCLMYTLPLRHNRGYFVKYRNILLPKPTDGLKYGEHQLDDFGDRCVGHKCMDTTVARPTT
jgi:hypothetical protein